MTSTLDSRDDGDLAKHSAAGPSTNGASGYRPPQSRTTGTGRNGGMVNVEPPKMEDLQPDYAQTLHADDAAAQGWYGSMSRLRLEMWQIYIH